MWRISRKTNKKKEVVDITDMVVAEIPDDYSGLCNIFLTHTTAALTTADLDPGTDLDMLDAFTNFVPKFAPSGVEGIPYRHPHDPSHAPDHIMSSLIGTSLTIPVEKGQLILGTWQRVVLIEFDGPRERNVIINLFSNS